MGGEQVDGCIGWWVLYQWILRLTELTYIKIIYTFGLAGVLKMQILVMRLLCLIVSDLFVLNLQDEHKNKFPISKGNCKTTFDTFFHIGY